MGEKKHPIILDEFRNEPITEDAKKGRGNNGNDGGGGNDMSKYITREEFNAAIKDLTHKIETNQEKTNHSFDLLSQKMESNEKLNSERLTNMKENIDKIDSKINTIVLLVVGSIMIPIILKFFGL
ncbi:hypothetical protein P7E14_14265 [Enterococcus gallinarum]|uniref:hypothetical protein n=1 Tax=Enterococcus gallinarum TaxID=1353 RepID=UPI002891FA02|nr:hypothetical protein [Enterococcus gallinarum]MDT2724995.1 hypothetical protein [Enterococcus gallinarum]